MNMGDFRRLIIAVAVLAVLAGSAVTAVGEYPAPTEADFGRFDQSMLARESVESLAKELGYDFARTGNGVLSKKKELAPGVTLTLRAEVEVFPGKVSYLKEYELFNRKAPKSPIKLGDHEDRPYTQIGRHGALCGTTYYYKASLSGLSWWFRNVKVVCAASLGMEQNNRADLKRLTDGAAMAELTKLAEALNQRLERAGVYESTQYRIDVAVVRNADVPNEALKDNTAHFPLSVRVNVMERAEGGGYRPLGKKTRLFVELRSAGGGLDLLACLRNLSDKTPGPVQELGPYSYLLLDADAKRQPLETNGSGEAVINLAGLYFTGASPAFPAQAKSAARGEAGSIELTPGPVGFYLFSHMELGRMFYTAGKQRTGASMQVEVLAPELNQRSASVTVTVDRMVEIEEHGTNIPVPKGSIREGKRFVAAVRHPWVNPNELNAFRYVEPARYPLVPSDRIQIGLNDYCILRWIDGVRCQFTTNKEAVKDPKDTVEFFVNPTQVEDWVDRANFPDDFRGRLAGTQFNLPVIVSAGKTGGGFLVSAICSKLPGGFLVQKGVGWVISTVSSAAGSKIATLWTPGVLVELKSVAYYRPEGHGQLFLASGQAVVRALDGKPQCQMTGGQAVRFGPDGRASAPVAYRETDLPEALREPLRRMAAADKAAVVAADASGTAPAAGGRSWVMLWILAGVVLLVVPAWVLVRRRFNRS